MTSVRFPSLLPQCGNVRKGSALESQIIARLTGGLGNQMFQYAAARTVADAQGKRLILDARRLDVPGMRSYALESFNIRFDHVVRSDPIELKRSSLGRRLQRRSIARTELPPLYGATSVHEADCEFMTERNTTTELVGFWQSPKYFVDNPLIHADFRLKLDAISDAIKLNEPGRYAVIHVRRGDYLHAKNRAKHPVLDLDYYKEIIERIQSVEPNIEILAVSDDPDWVSQQGLPVRIRRGANAIDDFRVMVHSAYLACANSTFSWWAGWLSQADEVYVPKFWDPLATDSALLDPRWKLVGQATLGGLQS